MLRHIATLTEAWINHDPRIEPDIDAHPAQKNAPTKTTGSMPHISGIKRKQQQVWQQEDQRLHGVGPADRHAPTEAAGDQAAEYST